jgi:hypothetical protein
MIFGAITNSWRQQLDGQDLVALVQEAQARGARHIELRQTCLGQYEHGEGEHWRPVLSRLASLVQAFPALTFDLAMAWPCLSQHTDPSGEPFQAALQGATLVGGATPHLRLVDPTAFECPWETPAEIPQAALSVADLAREAARQGVVLSMENSGQPIRSMALSSAGGSSSSYTRRRPVPGTVSRPHQPAPALSGQRPISGTGGPAGGYDQDRAL